MGKFIEYGLKKTRDDLEISQIDLAVALGVSVKTIQRAEKGDPLDEYVVKEICKYISERYRHQVTPEELGLRRRRKTRGTLTNGDATSDEEEQALIGEQKGELVEPSPVSNFPLNQNVFTQSTHTLPIEERTEELALATQRGEIPLHPPTAAQQDHSDLYVPLGSGLLVPFSLTTALGAELDDWAAWFAFKQTQILTIINSWNGRALFCSELQLLIDQEIKMLDEMKPQDSDKVYTLSRRQTIIAIAAFPLALLSSIQGSTSAFVIEELISRCAASITACWHLLKGSELSIVDRTVSSYLPTLIQLVQQSSRYQKTAARLVTQGYRLKGIVALHQNNLKMRETCCQRALYYGEIAENSSLLVAALISLASTFYYDKDPTKAASIYQKALLHMENIPPLQRARLSVELAVVYAQQGQERDALHFMDLAQKAYPEHPENDPSFLYAEFSPASMILEEGLTHLALAQHYPDREYGENAWSVFARIEEPQSQIPVPQRIFFEITNHQAETALVLRDQERFRSYLEKGVQGANTLNSKQRRREAIEVYKKAQTVWPHESRIEKLANLFL